MLITLSGLDGAGKSTLAEALKASLERDGMPAVVFHMNKDVGLYAYVRNLRDAIKGWIRKPGRPRQRTRAPLQVRPQLAAVPNELCPSCAGGSFGTSRSGAGSILATSRCSSFTGCTSNESMAAS